MHLKCSKEDLGRTSEQIGYEKDLLALGKEKHVLRHLLCPFPHQEVGNAQIFTLDFPLSSCV